MTLTDIGRLLVPEYFTPSVNSTTLDAAGELIAFIFAIPQTGTLKKICFATGTVTTGDTINVRIETVSTSTGYPTGSLYDAAGTGSQVVADADDYKLFWVAINGSTGISVTAGDIVAVVLAIDYVDGNMNINKISFGAKSFPYSYIYTGSVTKATTGLSLEYSTGIVYVPGLDPAALLTLLSIDNGTSPSIVGNRFTLPYGARVVGMWATNLDLDGNCNLVLYDSDGYTELASVSLDKDVRLSTAPGNYIVPIATPVILTANTYYRIAVRPTSTTNLDVTYMTTADDGALKGINAFAMGQNCVLTTTADNTPNAEGDWTQDDLSICACGIIIDQIDIGSAAAGVIGAGGLHGGFQL